MKHTYRTPEPPTEPKPPEWPIFLKRGVAGLLLTAVALASFPVFDAACSATTANAVVADITPAGACIAQALLGGGVSDPLQIVSMCAGTTIDDVIQVVETLLAANPSDAGADAGGAAMRAHLADVHAKALAAKAAKK